MKAYDAAYNRRNGSGLTLEGEQVDTVCATKRLATNWMRRMPEAKIVPIAWGWAIVVPKGVK